ncbi:class F sortase [Streptomyces hiroshimensis]|uniref:Class F sortase n=1 Tax=Streptomyces hiroshimensis TaxID=66424 RepID=A0ABQ2YGL5_9ACTN|nr:class F sortase [Streptomyces hiroshimensis]
MLLALCLAGGGAADEPEPQAPSHRGIAAKSHPHAPGLPPVHEALPEAGPQTLQIKVLGLKAPVESHGLDKLGGVELPPYERADAVAWYKDGPSPGSEGAAVIVGHVDTEKAPAVFAGLSVLKRGAKIQVTRTDGIVAEFTVEDISVVPNEPFDADKVYGPVDDDRPELRLITCGGDYDRNKHLYSANIVVTSYLTGATQPQQPQQTPQPQQQQPQPPAQKPVPASPAAPVTPAPSGPGGDTDETDADPEEAE